MRRIRSLIDRAVSIVDPYQPAKGPPPQRVGPFFRWALRGAEPAIAIGVGIVLLMGFSELVAAYFTGWAIDYAQAEGQGDFQALWPLLLFALLFFLFIRPVIFAADSSITTILLAPHLFPLVLSRINRHTLGHSLRYFENDFAGRISQKAIQTARAVSDIVIEIIDIVIYAAAMFIGALVLLGGIDARLLAIFLVWLVAWGFFLRFFIPRVQKRSAARAGARTNVSGQIVDSYANIAAVKLFAQDDFEDRAARSALESFRLRAMAFGEISALFRFLLMTLGGSLPLITISASLYLWSNGAASAGDIALTAMVATRISQVTNRVSMAAITIFANVGEIEDGIETLAPQHEVRDRSDAARDAHGPGAIRFERLTFAYGGEVAALRAVTLDVRPGEKVALVGASGAGKSTLVSLLLRLYEVEAGRILFDGTDIRDLTQAALRRQISVVRQDTSMFNRSALDNIRYGRPEAHEAEVLAAARQAEAHGFISDLRDHRGRSGYGAFLGERGVKLSGGQRQRIALARAILKDAPVLVLDEATSALDSRTEAAVQRALARLMADKTVIAIAHRLSTIAHMDRIVVLDRGRIAEEGSHAALLARGGLYAGFWARQSGGFLPTGGIEAAE
ncbi:MAG: ABC transporter ATP-binding protein [Pseudomonadota bacterium]